MSETVDLTHNSEDLCEENKGDLQLNRRGPSEICLSFELLKIQMHRDYFA
jgi:hypothetical protein